MDAADLVTALGLEPHPEGGHYRETFADASSTAIYYLLSRGEESTWHRIRERVEIWHFYAGAPLELCIAPGGPGGPGGASERLVLGTDVLAGERPQGVVPAGSWQRARSLGGWTLVGCTVAPPFGFELFDLAPGGGRAPDGTNDWQVPP